MNNGFRQRPRPVWVGLTFTFVGLMMISGFILFKLTDLSLQSHPVVQSSVRLQRAVDWCLESSLSVAIVAAFFFGGWVMVFLGVYLMGRNASPGSDGSAASGTCTQRAPSIPPDRGS
jgi:hypothetical protein